MARTERGQYRFGVKDTEGNRSFIVAELLAVKLKKSEGMCLRLICILAPPARRRSSRRDVQSAHRVDFADDPMM